MSETKETKEQLIWRLHGTIVDFSGESKNLNLELIEYITTESIKWARPEIEREAVRRVYGSRPKSCKDCDFHGDESGGCCLQEDSDVIHESVYRETCPLPEEKGEKG
jgi:hypothetical protein